MADSSRSYFSFTKPLSGWNRRINLVQEFIGALTSAKRLWEHCFFYWLRKTMQRFQAPD
jgi:hypothetical protein